MMTPREVTFSAQRLVVKVMLIILMMGAVMATVHALMRIVGMAVRHQDTPTRHSSPSLFSLSVSLSLPLSLSQARLFSLQKMTLTFSLPTNLSLCTFFSFLLVKNHNFVCVEVRSWFFFWEADIVDFSFALLIIESFGCFHVFEYRQKLKRLFDSN